MKRQTNNLKWRANLFIIKDDVDENDRPIIVRQKKRVIFYEELGITAQEKYLSQQAKTNIVCRINVRWDKTITEKDFSVEISGVMYNIKRIYTKKNEREMELSLTYVD